MALKLDLSGVKTFFFEKGEKFGMFACVAAAAVLIGYGLMGGVGANTGERYSSTINGAVANIKRGLEEGQPVPPMAKLPYDAAWPTVISDFPQGSLFPTQDTPNYKRLNPLALAIRADPEKKQIQLTYINGTYDAYAINPQFKTATVIKEAKAAGPIPKGPGNQIRQLVPGTPGAGLVPIIVKQPVRMVVVDAVFPLSEQLEEFRKKLRMSHQAELFAKGELPRFLGITVLKTEMTPGQPKVDSWLIRHDYKTDKLEVAKAVQDMLREAEFDNQLAGAPFAFQGLVMPQPKLASPLLEGISFPKAELEGIDWDDLVGVGPGVAPGPGGPKQMLRPGGGQRANPAMPAPAGAGAMAGIDIELDPKMPWRKLAPEFDEKFNDKFYQLDPAGIFPDPEEGKPQVVGQPNTQPVVPPNRTFFGPNAAGVSPYQGQSPYSATSQWAVFPAPEMPANLLGPNNQNPAIPQVQPRQPQRGVPLGQAPTKPYEALVRFIDVGVKPGSTYKYAVQVRIANPNFGKKTEVAYAKLAEIQELQPADPVETPTITIPEEYFLYAINQKPDNPKVVNGSDDKDPATDQVAVQIHRWAELAADDSTIGDWVIAERLLLHRGDPIGRITNIEIPIWDKKHAVYELGLSMVGRAAPPAKKNDFEKMPKDFGKDQGKKKAAGAELGSVGVPVNFAETTPPAVLADFDGGKRKLGNNLSDESASNLLILSADGKLIVRSSRADSEPNTDEYKTRQKRIDDWKALVRQLRVEQNGLGGPNNPQPNPFLTPKLRN